jgi:N-acetyl-gamma-glutamyl-phosphate reductase
VGVLGASGYAGRELCGFIARHPALQLAFAGANERAGECLPLPGGGAVRLEALADIALDRAQLVFSALPHGVSAAWVARARAAGAKVVDLSADLRPGNGNDTDIPYGLTEVARERVRGASVVANPGCYPTAILLALHPLARAGLIAPDGTIAVSAASGTTGAGSGARPDLLFSEVSEDFRAYGVGNGHRHLAEMRSTLSDLGVSSDLVFTPHLLPVARGILATMIVPLIEPLDDPISLWRDAFAGEPFLEVSTQPPTLRDVTRRNVVRVSATMAVGTRQPTLIVLSAIDNLVKGAAGQALQNANLMLGLDEIQGLPC